jgi:alanyl-tRNA synthetase
MTPSDAINRGAIALFGEKYGEEVRVVLIGKTSDSKRDSWSVELCGGTHVKKTSEILSFKIISETGVSSGIRRIEAVTNTAAIKFYNDKIDKVRNISNLLKTNNLQVEKKVEQLIEENQKINKELKLLKKNPQITKKINSVKETIKGVNFEYVIFDDLAIKELKSNAETLIKNNKSDIVCLISKIDDKASVVIAVEKKMTKKISAVEMVKEVSDILGGKGGGGRPDMAQSGGSTPENSLLAIETLKKYINNKF